MLSFELKKYILALVDRHPSVESIWLVGSRANSAEHAESDWDFIAFGGGTLFEGLSGDDLFHRSDVDFLVVLDDRDSLRRPWGRRKRGSLSNWNWKLLTEHEASYVGTKWIPDDEQVAKGRDMGDMRSTTLRAWKIWP